MPNFQAMPESAIWSPKPPSKILCPIRQMVLPVGSLYCYPSDGWDCPGILTCPTLPSIPVSCSVPQSHGMHGTVPGILNCPILICLWNTIYIGNPYHVVSEDANLSMKRTSLTVGRGVNQPYVTRTLVEQPGQGRLRTVLVKDSYGCFLNPCMHTLIPWSQLMTPLWNSYR